MIVVFSMRDLSLSHRPDLRHYQNDRKIAVNANVNMVYVETILKLSASPTSLNSERDLQRMRARERLLRK